MNAEFPRKFLTTDILITDIVVRVNLPLQLLLDKIGAVPGSKSKITHEQLSEFMEAIVNQTSKRFPGGSASNMIRTMQLLAPQLVSGRFIGTVGDDTDGEMIKRSFQRSGVELNLIENGIRPQTAISIVILYPHGERAIVTYPGNAAAIIKPHHFPESAIAETDHIPLQGSIRGKFDVAVIDEIMKHRWNHRKRLSLCFPTSAFDTKYFEWAGASANDVLSNVEELGFIMGVPLKETTDMLDKLDKQIAKGSSTSLERQRADLVRQRNAEIDEALHRLQTQQQKTSDKVLSNIGFGPQVAMITDGANGAHLITSDAIKKIPALEDVKVSNTLGGGDNSFAGFLFAKYVLGMDDIQSVNFAMSLAAAKLGYDGPVMDEPLEGLRQIAPFMAQSVDEKVAELRRSVIGRV